MDKHRLELANYAAASLLAGVSVTACGGTSGDGDGMDSAMTANATLSGTGTPTTTGDEETGEDTMASGDTTADSTTDASATDTSATSDTTTTGDGTTTGGGESPYEGGWDIGDCQDDVVAGTWSPFEMGPGVVLPDWYLTDSHGQMVRVRDFCHKAIYFDYSALW